MNDNTLIPNDNSEQSAAYSLLGYFAFYLTLANGSIWLTRAPGNVTTLWYASALGAAFLSLQPLQRWWRFVAVSLAALMVTHWIWDLTGHASMGGIPANIVEMLLGGMALRVLGRNDRLEENPWLMIWTVLSSRRDSVSFFDQPQG